MRKRAKEHHRPEQATGSEEGRDEKTRGELLRSRNRHACRPSDSDEATCLSSVVSASDVSGDWI
jgi:hypothetical protein